MRALIHGQFKYSNNIRIALTGFLIYEKLVLLEYFGKLVSRSTCTGIYIFAYLSTCQNNSSRCFIYISHKVYSRTVNNLKSSRTVPLAI